MLAAALMAGKSGAAVVAAPAFGTQTQIAPATVEQKRRAKAQTRTPPKRHPRRKSATDVMLIDLAAAKRARKAAKMKRDWATYRQLAA